MKSFSKRLHHSCEIISPHWIAALHFLSKESSFIFSTFRAFCRLGSPLCSNSPYAVLRTFNEHHKKDVDVVDAVSHDHKISLTVFNGDIEFSADASETPGLHEENEFQTDEGDSDNRKSVELRSDDVELDNNVDELDDSIGDVPDEENIPNVPADKAPLDGAQQEGEEKPPSIRKRDSSLSLTDSLTSSYSAISKIESMLDEEVDEEFEVECNDLREEIMRVCDRFEGKPLPQNLVKSVVSLTTPRNDSSSSPLEPPPFVEFSMAEDGYACLFVPSLTPQNVPISEYSNSFTLR